MEKSFKERVAEAKAVVSSVSPHEAKELHERGGAYFVDPRSAEAIASTTGSIPGAWKVSLQEIVEGRLPVELSDRGATVITSCQAGPMGAVAAHELVRQGFSSVRYVDGGTQGWLDAGFGTQR